MRRFLALVPLLALTLAGFAAGRATRGEPASVPESPVAADPAPSMPGTTLYPIRILRVLDGDTVEARVAVWPGHELTTLVRLAGIDAPELRAACDLERTRAQAAQRRLEQLAGEGALRLGAVRPDKYFGRVVTNLLMPGGRDVSAVLLAEGMVRPYAGRRRQGWCAAGPDGSGHDPTAAPLYRAPS